MEPSPLDGTRPSGGLWIAVPFMPGSTSFASRLPRGPRSSDSPCSADRLGLVKPRPAWRCEAVSPCSGGDGRVYLSDSMPTPMDDSELIYDWNEADERWEKPPFRVQLDDETLRDGLQSPSVKTPPIEDKLAILHLMSRLGIDTADIGLPGAGPHVVADVTRLAQEIAGQRLPIQANCAARTLRQDITPVIEISQKAGIPIEVCTFIGSSPIRQYAENWTLETMLAHTEDAVSYAVENGLPVMYVTEDTVRAQPATLRALFLTAIRCGAKRLCLCDTVGHATPTGAANLVHFAKEVVRESGAQVELDWHGHSDRGLAVINTIAAIR